MPTFQTERETNMAQVEITPQSLIVHITAADQLWSLKSLLEIPLAHVVEANHATNDADTWLEGLHIGAVYPPGVLSAGSIHNQDDRVYWDVHDAAHAIAIVLKDDRYARLVIEVDDPAATLAAIAKALQAQAATRQR